MTDKIHDGGPAFPRPAALGEISGRVLQDYGDPGMSLRDWFATHAPSVIPLWFHHVSPPVPAQPPGWDDLPTKEDQSIARSWLDDEDPKIEELPKHLQTWAQKRADASAAVAVWRMKNNWMLVTQWRWAYADAMLAAREE